jgi:hypothetical protein
MTNASRIARIGLLAFGTLVLAGTSPGQQRPPILEQIAKTYGLDSWGQVEAIRYTFNLQLPALKLNLTRSWEWEPKTGKVSFEGKDKEGKPVKATYVRSELSSQPDFVKNVVDPGFTNDNYWLLFPFHAYWDTSATVTDEGMHKLPVGTGSATLVSVKYGAELGGYTPGDTWDLYVGKDNRVEYLVFRHGGSAKPSVTKVTYTGDKKAGPLLISTEHRGTADGKPVHLFLSDVSVKLTGSDSWMNAQ